ncbi:Zinc transporter ZIP1-like 2 [Homarus americanus]|uniref:Zinc transporter ZIP3 n=1 Tax=Homarus americanus TaxID=6706 RepID=A0A8J5JRA1_HOMAM|nr:Zinc transporter ZIP1-like 2 [Homarus americanus]
MEFMFTGIIFLLTTATGLMPVLMRGIVSKKMMPRSSLKSRLLSCASCFGAGVFLFVCFMGLLPAADRKFHHFLEELGHTDESWEAFAEFPWGFFVVTCGFLIIFTIDKLKQPEDTCTESPNGLVTNDMNNPHKHNPHKHYHHQGHGVPSSVIFLLALGIHSLFEGMAVGLQTQKEKVLEFSVAVLVHEVVMAFTFGMEVSKSHILSRCNKIIYVMMFTSTIPLGIVAGVGLQSAPSENREIISAVLEAFATGIFIHVIFIEILAKEFPEHHHDRDHHDDHDDHDNNNISSKPSEVCLMLEKMASICCGILLLILLNVFMHAHH